MSAASEDVLLELVEGKWRVWVLRDGAYAWRADFNDETDARDWIRVTYHIEAVTLT